MTAEELDAVATAQLEAADAAEALLKRAKAAEARLVPADMAKQAADELISWGVLAPTVRERAYEALADPAATLDLFRKMARDYAVKQVADTDWQAVAPGTPVGRPADVISAQPTADDEWDAGMARLRQLHQAR